jgi:hypothetical protein
LLPSLTRPLLPPLLLPGLASLLPPLLLQDLACLPLPPGLASLLPGLASLLLPPQSFQPLPAPLWVPLKPSKRRLAFFGAFPVANGISAQPTFIGIPKLVTLVAPPIIAVRKGRVPRTRIKLSLAPVDWTLPSPVAPPAIAVRIPVVVIPVAVIVAEKFVEKKGRPEGNRAGRERVREDILRSELLPRCQRRGVHGGRIVARQVDDVVVGRTNSDLVVFLYNHLRGVADEVSSSLGLVAHALHRHQNVLVLAQHRIPKLFGPFEVCRHPLNQGGEPGKKHNYARVPVLIANRLGQLRVGHADALFQQPVSLNYLQGEG